MLSLIRRVFWGKSELRAVARVLQARALGKRRPAVRVQAILAVNAQNILGDHILSFQAGNEPDLYVNHGHRPSVRSRALLNLESMMLMTPC